MRRSWTRHLSWVVMLMYLLGSAGPVCGIVLCFAENDHGEVEMRFLGAPDCSPLCQPEGGIPHRQAFKRLLHADDCFDLVLMNGHIEPHLVDFDSRGEIIPYVTLQPAAIQVSEIRVSPCHPLSRHRNRVFLPDLQLRSIQSTVLLI